VWDRAGSFGGLCSGDTGPGTVFDRLGFPEEHLPEGPATEANNEPEARTETDAPSSISVSIARSNAPPDRIVVCVADEALRARLGPALAVREVE
jgi:hypothetical protein